MKPVTTKKPAADALTDKNNFAEWEKVMKQAKTKFETKYVSANEKALVSQIREILFALDEGPQRYGAPIKKNVGEKAEVFSTNYIDWTENPLKSAQFKLSRLIEPLTRFKAQWKERTDHIYIYHKISFAQDFTFLKKRAQELIEAGERKHRITDTEVESEITPKLFELEEFKIFAGGRYEELDGLQRSMDQVIRTIGQELADRKQERNLPQNQH